MKRSGIQKSAYLGELIGEMFDEAPRQVEARIKAIIQAINRGDLSEALNELQQAQAIVDEGSLEDWRAELLTIWAYYYHASGAEGKVWQCIKRARKLEPDNKRLWQVIELIDKHGEK